MMKDSLAKYAEKQSNKKDLSAIKTPKPDFNDLTGAMGVGLPKVTGQKKAKQEKKEMDAIQVATKRFTQKMDDLNGGLNKVTAIMARDSQLMAHKSYMQMAQYYKSQYDEEKVKQYMAFAHDALMQHAEAMKAVSVPKHGAPLRQTAADGLLELGNNHQETTPAAMKQPFAETLEEVNSDDDSLPDHSTTMNRQALSPSIQTGGKLNTPPEEYVDGVNIYTGEEKQPGEETETLPV